MSTDRAFDLSRNKISGQLSAAMFRKMEASTMDFSGNFLVGSIPKLSPKLGYLELSLNNLSGPLPSDLKDRSRRPEGG